MNEKQLRDVQPELAENLKTITMKSKKYVTIDSEKMCERQGGAMQGQRETLLRT